MANQDAWNQGWELGQKVATKNKNKNNKKKPSGKSSSPSSTVSPGAVGGNPWSILSYIPKLHSGGKVKKTGTYRLKKGEVVLTSSQQKKIGIKKTKNKSGDNKKSTKKV